MLSIALLLALAAAMIVVDRIAGLGLILASFGALLAGAVALVAVGVSWSIAQEVVAFAAPAVFALTAIRLFLADKNRRSGANGDMQPPPPHDRNAIAFFRVLTIANDALGIFLFHFISFAFLSSFAMRIFNADDLEDPYYAAIPPACGYFAGKIAKYYGATGTWQVFWASVGLLFVGSLTVAFAVVLGLARGRSSGASRGRGGPSRASPG